MTELHAMLAEARPWLDHYGYAALFLAIMAEGMGIPAPGQTLLIGAGLLAGSHELDPMAVVVCGISAALIGDNLGYLLGRYGGRRLILRLGVNRRRLRKLGRFYRQKGRWAVFFDCYFDGTRQLGSLLAGSAAVPWRRFMLYDGAGSSLWVLVWGYGTAQVERHAAMLQLIWSHINPWVAALSLTAIILLGWWLWRRSSDNISSTADGDLI